MNAMNQEQIKASIDLLTEVACCTIDIHDEATESFQICEKTVGYLSENDPKPPENFKTQTEKVKNYKGKKFYVTSDYPEKPDDLRMAIALLNGISKAPDTPAEKAEVMSKAADLITDFYDVEIRGSIEFITEQACCLIQSNGKPELMQAFNERVDAVTHDPEADYNTEQYDGKKTDLRNAVADLTIRATSPETTTEQGKMLKHAAEMIAAFYGMEDILPNAA